MSKTIKIILLLLIAVALIPTYKFNSIKAYNATYLQTVQYESFLETTGIIETEKYTEISFSYPLYIKNCYISNGNYVNKGQLLFEVDKEKMESYVKNNNFTHIANTNFNIDNTDLYDVPEAIYASESGYIQDLYVTSGSLIMPEENLCRIKQSDEVILKISVNQEDYEKISVGDIVEFSPVMAPSKSFVAKICNKTANIKKETSLTGTKTVIEIYAIPLDENEYLINGLQIRGKIITDPLHDIKALPYNYINQDDTGEYVMTYQRGVVRKEYINTGIETTEYAEILTDFSENTLFIENEYSGGKLVIEYDK